MIAASDDSEAASDHPGAASDDLDSCSGLLGNFISHFNGLIVFLDTSNADLESYSILEHYILFRSIFLFGFYGELHF